MSESLQSVIQDATKAAMKARDKERVAALRLINAEIKRVEVDERKTLVDADILTILTRMVKQRNDSLSQYEAAGREDLAAKERYELDLIQEFMPEQLGEDKIAAEVAAAIEQTGAAGMQDMGKVMGVLSGKLKGRADMGLVSKLVKAALG